jgi:hypothetical protein
LIEHRRIAFALLLSLIIHALLLSLTFDGEGLGLPGFGFPWQDRRIEAPALIVRLIPPQAPPAEPAIPSVAPPLQQGPVEQPSASRPPPTLSAPPAPHGLEIVPSAGPTAEAKPTENARAGADTARALPRAEGPADAAPTTIIELPVTDLKPANEVEAARQAAAELEAQRHEAARQEAARIEAGRQEAQRQEAARQAAAELEAQRQEAARQEAARIEAGRQEAQRQEAARQAAAELEAQRQEAARQEAARIEAGRQEVQRQEAARQAAAELEAQRQEAARQEAARIEAARQEAQRQEAARQEIARQEAARQAAVRQQAASVQAGQEEARREERLRAIGRQLDEEAAQRKEEAARQEIARQDAARQAPVHQQAARVPPEQEEARREERLRAIGRQLDEEAAQRKEEAARQEIARQEAARQAPVRQQAARVPAEQEEARREERLRAIGRQLDEEAARREAASITDREPNLLPLSLSRGRRVKLFGRSHPNVELIQYAEAWAQRFQLNTEVETIREVANRPHRDPVVTVAIRSDGSVESVTFELPSGVAEVDDAIRQIVERQKPYVAFPQALAREYDVVEIRRTWHFDTVIRLY